MNNNKYKLVYMAAISYAIITGLSFLFTKIALGYGDPTDILAHRFTASFIAISIPVLMKWTKVDYNKERIKKIIPLAILYPLMFFGFQTFGLIHASSSEAGILMAAAPVFTLILATYFLKEKTNILQKISIVLSVLGVIYIMVMKGSAFDVNNMTGIILLVLSALCFSGYSVMARSLTKDFTTIELSYMMTIISFICFNVVSIGNHIIRGDIKAYITPLGSLNYIIAIVYLGVLSSLGTSLLTNYVLSKIEASKMSVFSNLGTVISIVAGVVFLKEEIFYYHIIGSIFIIGGVIGTNFLGDKDSK
ncbi:putative drug/metabolite transporter [Gottschalkia acidurici 9a]|uniref:Drug/metabolite transporter n=1 Tax=Gottschalkia acidurici (strain ATCC 7906 / DSM 604 / BCRC 14475 / CIP 104303 / KCTC 5404 / NCIMB 10678 / 9a) TaxID=1128398 RepID=K0B1M6_GOTA9|nr:DMT family transporter [Gottschalkia acidurici]AFS78997.1 putative drug/metabolite transporter [Gottschalkia acidurici 9a]